MRIREQFEAAYSLATKGAITYGVGLSVEIAGGLALAYYLSGNFQSSDSGQSPDGIFIMLLSGAMFEIIGTVVAVSGGSQACRIIRTTRYQDQGEFRGWTYFLWGMLFYSGATFSAFKEYPIVCTVLSLAGFSFNVGSVVHSVRYARSAYQGSIAAKDIQIAPMLSSIDSKPIGLKLKAEF